MIENARIIAGDFTLILKYQSISPDSYDLVKLSFIHTSSRNEIDPESGLFSMLDFSSIYRQLEEIPIPEQVKTMTGNKLHKLDRSTDFVRAKDIFFQNYRLTTYATQNRFNPSSRVFAYVKCVNTKTEKEVDFGKLPNSVLTGFYKKVLALSDESLKLYLAEQLTPHIREEKKQTY